MADRAKGRLEGATPDEGDPRTDDSWRRARERVGTVLRGKWRLDSLLGVGGMAAVYAATHRNGSRGAVKILHPELSNHTVIRETFLWEGYVTNAVGHPGVVKVIDDEADDGSLFLVAELLEGETLEQRRLRSDGRLPPEEVLFVTDRLLDILAAAHKNGIVHQDIKPENLFLTRQGQVKLLDFGIARLRRVCGPSGPSRNGLASGTPAYMPPEQARGVTEEVDERSDLWSCGATMFCLLSGRLVHDAPTLTQQLTRAMTTPAPPLASAVPGVDPAIAAVVDRALALGREARWPNAAAMREAVRQAHQGLTKNTIADAGLSASVTPPVRAMVTSDAPVALPPDGPSPVDEALDLLPPFVRTRPRHLLGALIAASLLGGAVIGVTWKASAVAPPAAAAAPLVSSCLPGPPPEIPRAAPPPEASPPPAPAVTEAKVERPAPTVRRSAPSPATSSAPARRADCNPPYVVDAATGKKHWNLECL
ncbi:MAG TPA: serine/threonine-protein kinase [Polyangiaceae bacterium]|nr:serine/threonine-protein kinase [Polyangiaceae bacterium]